MDFAALYEDDIEGWAEAQVVALRRLASTPGPWSNVIDWDNVIDEVEDLGSDRRRAVESLLQNAVAHALKIMAEPSSLSADQWRKEVVNYIDQARVQYKASMRRSIDLERLWRRAVRDAETALLEGLTLRPLQLPDACPFTVDDLTRAGVTVDEVLLTISKASGRTA